MKLLFLSNYAHIVMPVSSMLKGSNTLNNTGVWSLIELASLYTVPLSAINGLSRLTTTSNGQTRPIRKFSNWPITVESNRSGRFEFESNLEALQVPNVHSNILWLMRVVMPSAVGCWSCSSRLKSCILSSHSASLSSEFPWFLGRIKHTTAHLVLKAILVSIMCSKVLMVSSLIQ